MTRLLRSAALLLAVITVLPAASASGADREPRIVGGSQATIAEWPWQVAIAEPPSSGGNGFERQFCGGTLVAPTIVITAAHCVYSFSDPVGLVCQPLVDGFNAPASEFSVITGRTRLSSSQGQEIPAAEIYYFEPGAGGTAVATPQSSGDGDGLFDCQSFEWDVVFLKLAGASASQPIQLAGAGESALWAPGKPAVITGWGTTSEGGARSDTLRAAGISIVGDPSCASPAAYGATFIAETMLCAGIYPAGGRDTCQGDSGGPLVVAAPGGEHRLVGDTSFGDGCARPNKPGVYGRVADDPMRTALAQGIAQVSGGYDVTGEPDAPVDPGPGTDAAAPQTRIDKHPRRKARRRRAKFKFSADEAGVHFQCRVDRKRFRRCESPYRKRVKRRRRHTFRVRAIDAAGNIDPKPAKFRWRVKRRGNR